MARDLLLERDISQDRTRKELLEAYKTGYTVKELAESVGIIRQSLDRFLRGHDLYNKSLVKVERWIITWKQGIRVPRTQINYGKKRRKVKDVRVDTDSAVS